MKSGKPWSGILLGILVAIGGAALLPFIGVFDMTATGGKNILDWWGNTNLHSTLRRNAPEENIPSTASAAQGLSHYSATCLLCHGAPEISGRQWSESMLPQPPKLWQKHTQNMEDGELFYIASYGIRMSGMPAFGPLHSENDIWNLVALLRQLDTLEEDQKDLLREAAVSNHHGGDEGSADHAHSK